jgi:hypothetical protein
MNTQASFFLGGESRLMVSFPVDFLLLDYLAFFFAEAEAINFVEAFVIV